MKLHGPRGKGVRRKVCGYTKLPDNWMDFLRDSMHKKELCYSDSQGCTVHLWQPAVYVTSGQVVVSIGENIPGQNFNHVKACGSVMHALKQGEQTIYVRTVDTEVVVVILAGVFHDMVAGQHLVDI